MSMFLTNTDTVSTS